MKYFRLFLMFFGVFGIFLGCQPARADITGYYYNWTGDTPPANPFPGLPLLIRTDPNVDFNFDSVPAPDPIGRDKFAVRWHGLLRVPNGGRYTFYANTDDGARLYVNGTINIKEWRERGAPGFPGTAGTGVVLGAGWNDIVFEFYENGGAAVAQLNWNGPDFAEKQTIPASVLAPTNDLRVYIPMSVAGDGAASDYSGECHDGIIIGNPGLRTGCDGTINGAFTFDGATQYLKLANSKYVQLALADRGYTVSAWVYLTAFPVATNTVVVQNRGADTGAQRSLSLGFFAKNMGASGDDVTSRVAFAVDGQSILIGAYTDPNVFSLNEWHHLAGTWNGSGTNAVAANQFKIYVDGVKMTTTEWGTGTAPTPPLLGSQPAEIAHHLAWNSFFPGSVDEVRIFDKELAQEEITQLYGDLTPAMGPYAGPSVTSMTRLSPSPVPANLSTIDYKVVFNQPVHTVAADDFSVESLDAGGASANVLSVSGPSVTIGPLGFDTLGGGTLGGNDAALLATGGQGDNGPCLQLTSNQGGKNGIWFIQSPAVAESFRASFSLFVNNPPNDHGADGFEFTYGANGNGGQGPEGPGGQGITVCFDTWNNDTDSPGGRDGFPYSTSTSKPTNGAGLTYGNIVVKCNGQVVGNYVNYMRFESGEWIPVIIEVTNNGATGYMCNVYWGAAFTPSGTTTPTPAGWTHCNVPLRGYAPAANWYFGIGAATGGANDLQLVDNLEIISSDRTVSLNNMQGSGSLRMNLNDTDSTITNYENIPIAPNTWNGGENYFFDYTPPTVTISEPSSARTKSGPVTYTVTYGEESTITLKSGDITLNQTGSADGSVSVSGSGNTSRTVTISGITGNGTLGISIGAGTASDSLGNIALGAGPSAVFTVDNTGPSVQIGPPSTLLTKSGPVSFTVTYTGADVVLLDPGDVMLNKTGTANGAVSVSGTGNVTRTVTLDNITGDGLLGISLSGGTAADDLGNLAPGAGPSAMFTTDNTGPGIWIDAPSAPLATTGPITYTVTYTEAVSISLSSTNVLLNRMGTANGSVSVSGTGNTTRTVTVSGITGNGTLGISLLAGTALDELGNNALAMGPSLTFIVDNARPACTVSTASASPTAIQPIVYQVSFNEPVYGLEPAEVTVSNGVVTGMTGGPAVYSVAVTPTGAPPTSVSVSVAQNMAQDAAGNQNMASNTVSV
nr:PA14 domain-containing protein [Candidatus Hydrogenedentota bacterium]